jgi:hypothetical protein
MTNSKGDKGSPCHKQQELLKKKKKEKKKKKKKKKNKNEGGYNRKTMRTLSKTVFNLVARTLAIIL